MSSYPTIQIIIDGTSVSGTISYRSEADISVNIISPYHDLSAGLHIPYFSRPLHSFLTDYGDRTAENLLTYLYELGVYMEANRKFMKLQFALHFRDGDLSNHECQNRFFSSTFPFVVPIDTRGDVLRKLQ